jgi:hypothetical protein
LKENREKRERTEEERVAEEENRKKEGWQKFRMEQRGEDYSRGNAPEQVVSAAGREGDERTAQRENKEREEGMERIKDLLPEGLDSVYRHFLGEDLPEIIREGRIIWPTNEQIERAKKLGYTQAFIIPGGVSYLDILKTLYTSGPTGRSGSESWRVYLSDDLGKSKMNLEAIEGLQAFQAIERPEDEEGKARIIFVRPGDIEADSASAGEILDRTDVETEKAVAKLERKEVGVVREAEPLEILIQLLSKYRLYFDSNNGDANQAWIHFDESLFSKQIFPKETLRSDGEPPTTQATMELAFKINGKSGLIGVDTQSHDGIRILIGEMIKNVRYGVAHPLVLEVSEVKK